MKEKLILASGSPRRKELLRKAGLEYTVEVCNEEEIYTKTLPQDIVQELAHQKAYHVASRQTEPCIVLGADTVVAVDDRILGKPATEDEAAAMVRSFQGRAHQVYTGVCLIRVSVNETVEKTFYECTNVHVVPMSEADIRDYINVGESMDAAGAYKIQGAFGKYIDHFEGDYENIIGLPITRVLKELENFE